MKSLSAQITACESCPRLRNHCLKIAQVKRRAYIDEPYWGKPITGFGDSDARILIIGLAPAAHGANRTGRIFTGDRSGDWLFRALYRAGFANQPTSVRADDGLRLQGVYITCTVKCAPPENRPTTAEIKRCSSFLFQELKNFEDSTLLIALGNLAYTELWKTLEKQQGIKKTKPKFGHGKEARLGNRLILMSFHPSQQNTFTGRLTEAMFDSIFTRARQIK